LALGCGAVRDTGLCSALAQSHAAEGLHGDPAFGAGEGLSSVW